PIGILAYYLTNRVLRLLPRHEVPHAIDVIGAALVVFASVSLLLLLTWGGTTFPWASAPILALAAVTVAAWVLFALRLLSAPEPFVPLAVLGNPVVTFGVIGTFFGVGATVGLSVFTPLFFEAVIGLSATQSGLALIALMGGTVVGANLTGRVMLHFDHYKWVATTGLAVSAVAMAVLAAFPAALGLIGVEVALAVAGIGMGTIFPITTTAVQNAVQTHQMGTTTGVLNFFRSLGGAIVVAVFGAIFFTSLSTDLPHASIEQAVVEGAGAGFD